MSNWRSENATDINVSVTLTFPVSSPRLHRTKHHFGGLISGVYGSRVKILVSQEKTDAESYQSP